MWPRGLSVAALLSQPPPVQDELLRALRTQSADEADDDEAVGGGGAERQPSYSWLRRARTQIARDAGAGGAGWTLHLDGDRAPRRTGDCSRRRRGPATDSRARGGGGGAPPAARGCGCCVARGLRCTTGGALDASIAHPASCRLRASRWAEATRRRRTTACCYMAWRVARGCWCAQREGDVHQPAHAEKPLKLSHYLRAQKVELSERRPLPLVLQLAEGDADADANAANAGLGARDRRVPGARRAGFRDRQRHGGCGGRASAAAPGA